MTEAQVKPTTPDREFLYHIFHLMSQPMTALQCSLELALVNREGLEECRSSIEFALENIDRLRRRLLLVREMADACDPGDISCPVDLGELVEEAVEQLQPLLESIGHMPALRLSRVQVVGERGRLLRAFLYLLESLLGNTSTKGEANSVISLHQEGCEATARVAGRRVGGMQDSSRKMSAELEIARRTFEAVGGRMSLTQHCSAEWSCEVVLQAAPAREEYAVAAEGAIGKKPQFS
jgi:hypothetical protein